MESTFIILFSIASLVAFAVRRTSIPYTVGLVVVGLVAGQFQFVSPPQLTKDLLFALFLPGLVFEAAYNLHVTELRSSWRAIATLAVPGVIISIGLVAAAMFFSFRLIDSSAGMDWRTSVVFAALVAATDPIAVVALFRQLGVPQRLTTLVEAESLFNDGTSIVVLSLVLAFVTGTGSSVAALSLQFVLVIGGGVLVGGALAFGIARLAKHVDDPMLEIQLTTIAAYGSFVVAERLHLSGVIATVTAGLVLGTYGREISMSRATRLSVDTFWQYVAFALNSIVFLLIGFSVRPTTLLASAGAIAIAFIAVVVARGGVVFGVMAALSRTTERFSAGWATVITWGGLRGALSMVLALALPIDFPNRGLLIDLTFGVVVVSIVVQGTTMHHLIKWRGLVRDTDTHLGGAHSPDPLPTADQ
ncbi:MAG TPA: sodium:proton antiporter [Gemmatimonadaceae bacterium]|jgi:CPA1 family monovalent cation:H+ antiporter